MSIYKIIKEYKICVFVKDKDIFLYKAPPEETLFTKEQNNFKTNSRGKIKL